MSEADLFLAELKDLELAPEPRITMLHFQQLDAQRVAFDVQARHAAPLVTFETPLLGHFSANAFTLHACSTPRRVVFTSAAEPLAAIELHASIAVSSLQDYSFADEQMHPSS